MTVIKTEQIFNGAHKHTQNEWEGELTIVVPYDRPILFRHLRIKSGDFVTVHFTALVHDTKAMALEGLSFFASTITTAAEATTCIIPAQKHSQQRIFHTRKNTVKQYLSIIIFADDKMPIIRFIVLSFVLGLFCLFRSTGETNWIWYFTLLNGKPFALFRCVLSFQMLWKRITHFPKVILNLLHERAMHRRAGDCTCGANLIQHLFQWTENRLFNSKTFGKQFVQWFGEYFDGNSEFYYRKRIYKSLKLFDLTEFHTMQNCQKSFENRIFIKCQQFSHVIYGPGHSFLLNRAKQISF